MRRILISAFSALLFFLSISSCFSQEKISVAVAANFITPFQEMTRVFTVQTGIHVEMTFGSTGQLYAQIINGAPYDLFLSADQEKPDLLYKEKRSEAPFVYATGRVVLWTLRKELCRASDWRQLVAMPGVKKIAIANPKASPYGAAAQVALGKSGLPQNVQDRLVFAQNIAQAFQYASTGSVDAGFCALSAALSEEGRKGCSFNVDEAPPVVQSACLLKRSAGKSAPEKLVRFLASPEATVVKMKYGYR